MKRGWMLALSLPMVTACGFSDKAGSGKSYDYEDPFHDTFSGVNEVYMENPVVEYPTRFGNIVLWIAAAPIWGLVAVPEDAARGDGKHPVARGIMASAGYAGGAAIGTPFLALYWLLYRWWAGLVWNLDSPKPSPSESESPGP